METLFLILIIGFAIFMFVTMFKYAKFIHHYPRSKKSNDGKEVKAINPVDKKNESSK